MQQQQQILTLENIAIKNTGLEIILKLVGKIEEKYLAVITTANFADKLKQYFDNFQQLSDHVRNVQNIQVDLKNKTLKIVTVTNIKKTVKLCLIQVPITKMQEPEEGQLQQILQRCKFSISQSDSDMRVMFSTMAKIMLRMLTAQKQRSNQKKVIDKIQENKAPSASLAPLLGAATMDTKLKAFSEMQKKQSDIDIGKIDEIVGKKIKQIREQVVSQNCKLQEKVSGLNTLSLKKLSQIDLRTSKIQSHIQKYGAIYVNNQESFYFAKRWINLACQNYKMIQTKGHILKSNCKNHYIFGAYPLTRDKRQYSIEILNLQKKVGFGIIDQKYISKPKIQYESNMVMFNTQAEGWNGKSHSKINKISAGKMYVVEIFPYSTQVTVKIQGFIINKIDLQENHDIKWVPFVYLESQMDIVRVGEI